MAETLPWVDEQAAKDAIAAVRKDSDETDWYVLIKRRRAELHKSLPLLFLSWSSGGKALFRDQA